MNVRRICTMSKVTRTTAPTVTEEDIDDASVSQLEGSLPDEGLIDLLDNPFIYAIHGKRIFYTKDFYIAMYKKVHDEKMTAIQAYEALGFPVARLGTERARQAAKNAMAKAEKNELFTTDPASYDGSIPLEQMGPLNPSELCAYLTARCTYLESLVEAQKKIPSILAEMSISSRNPARK